MSCLDCDRPLCLLRGHERTRNRLHDEIAADTRALLDDAELDQFQVGRHLLQKYEVVRGVVERRLDIKKVGGFAFRIVEISR